MSFAAGRPEHRATSHRPALLQRKVTREVRKRRNRIVRPLLHPQPLLHLELKVRRRTGESRLPHRGQGPGSNTGR